MPSTIWNGALTFGLVSVPVKLYSTTRSNETLRFHEYDRGTGGRIRHRRIVEDTGEEVPYDAIVKGVELDDGRVVTVERAELDALAPERSRVIEVEDFVPLGDIDPLVFDRGYFVGPADVKAGAKPYEVLRRAMLDAGRVGVGRFVLRNKAHLAVVRPTEDALVLHTLYFADELRPVTDVPDLPDDVEVSERELAAAVMTVESLTGEWEHDRYSDSYREAVRELVEAKAAGQEPSEPTAIEAKPSGTVDLADALEASVKAARERRAG